PQRCTELARVPRFRGPMVEQVKALLRALATMAIVMLGTQALAQPTLVRRGEATQLEVRGQPFLVLGGELSNSAASSAAYMAPVWPKLRSMNLNTVLAPVSWQLIEPSEGRFDFSSVDAL